MIHPLENTRVTVSLSIYLQRLLSSVWKVWMEQKLLEGEFFLLDSSILPFNWTSPTFSLSPKSTYLFLDFPFPFFLFSRTIKVNRPNNYNLSIFDQLPPASSKQLYLANLNEFVSEIDVRSIFEAFGEVTDCKMVMNESNQKHLGCG